MIPNHSANTLHYWRLSSKLAAAKATGETAVTPCPAPPPDLGPTLDGANDRSLASWLTGGGTEVVCSIAAKAMCQMVETAGATLANGVLAEARQAASTAAAQELGKMESKPIETLRAALDGAAERVATKLQQAGCFSAAARLSADSCTRGISNGPARVWWVEYIGERRSVRSNMLIEAFALWLEKEGLPEAEAHIRGALAVFAIDGDEDGDITTAEFEAFTSQMRGQFTPESVRTLEVTREDPDAADAEQFAVYLGISPEGEPHLMWIAEQCRVAPLPQGWAEYLSEDGRSYFHNAKRGETVWQHPLDLYFKQLVEVRRNSHTSSDGTHQAAQRGPVHR